MIMPERARMPRSATKPIGSPVRNMPQATPMMPKGAVKSVMSMARPSRTWKIKSVMMRKIMAGTGTRRYFIESSLSARLPSGSIAYPAGRFSRSSFVAAYAFFAASVGVPAMMSARTVTAGFKSRRQMMPFSAS